MILKLVIVSLMASGLALANSGPPVQGVEFNAFQISKEKNGNLVKYDVRLNPDCSFAGSDALSIYWMIQDKAGHYQRKDMNFIENGYYGLAVTKKTPHEIAGQVKSLKNRDINIELRIQASANANQGASKCMVQTLGSGSQLQDTVRVSSIKLEDFHGQIPHRLAVIGKKNGSKEPVKYQISLK